MLVIMVMVMVMMVMMAMTVMMTVIMAAIMVIRPALGLEGPRDGSCHSALAAHHLCQNVIVLDIERISGDFRRRVPVADMPGDPHQPQRVLGADFEERLRRRHDAHEPLILPASAHHRR